MAGCGYPPAIIDSLILQDVRDLFTYWDKYPPENERHPPLTPTPTDPTITAEEMAARLAASGGKITRKF